MLNKQKGFTLVELMVAMAIGTVIILGAGQLFLTTFQTFKAVDELSRKQETLIYVTGAVVQDIRSAISIDVMLDSAAIELSLSPRGSDCNVDEYFKKRYLLTETNGNFSLSIRRKCEIETGSESGWGSSEPLVEGFYDDSEESFLVRDLGDGLYELTIKLATEKGENYEEFVLLIQNRLSVFL